MSAKLATGRACSINNMRKPTLNQAQLFLDDTCIEDSAFVTRVWHRPDKFPEPVLRAEHPWEQWCPVLYGTVLKWNGKFHMWYVPWTLDGHRPVCYAQSEDGVAWHKPELGLFESNATTATNIVLDANNPPNDIDDLTVIDDPEDQEWPLKMLYWEGAFGPTAAGWRPTPGTGIYAARSKDGIHWDREPGLVLPEWGDRFNAVSSKVNGKYVLMGRIPGALTTGAQAGAFDKGRAVWRIESEDLLNWSEVELVLAADVEDPAHMQFYSATAFPYASLMMGSIERMHMSPDKLDPELIWSHDGGRNWIRSRQRAAFLEWGAPSTFDDAWINLQTNGPIEHQGRLWFYYSGRNAAHGSRYPHNYGAIGLATLRIDGFASLQARDQVGYVLTRPMQWPEGDLHVNFDARRDLAGHPGFSYGELLVEVRDENNFPVEGFGWDACHPLTGNTADRPGAAARVEWRNGRSVRELAGQPIRLAFKFRDCHLYSFRVSAGTE